MVQFLRKMLKLNLVLIPQTVLALTLLGVGLFTYACVSDSRTIANFLCFLKEGITYLLPQFTYL